MSISVLVDPAVVRKALDFTGEELGDQRMLGEIMIRSGSVFLLRYKWTDDGNRIEVDHILRRQEWPYPAGLRTGGTNRRARGWLARTPPAETVPGWRSAIRQLPDRDVSLMGEARPSSLGGPILPADPNGLPGHPASHA
jgi:hypothetical protein